MKYLGSKNSEISVDKFEETESTFTEEIREQCVKNKDRIEQYSKITTIILVLVLALITLSFWENKWVLMSFMCLSTFSFYGFGNTLSNDRIFCKFPNKLGIILISVATLFFATQTEVFSKNTINECIVGWAVFAFCIWSVTYFTHLLSIDFFENRIFKNPQFSYTARITKLNDFVNKGKHEYSVEFADYTITINSINIEKELFDTLKTGDVIKAILQPKIDTVQVKSIVPLPDFQGLTDMEQDQQKHEIEVETFGQEQEKIESGCMSTYTPIFILIDLISLFASVVFFVCCKSSVRIIEHQILDSTIHTLNAAIAIIEAFSGSLNEYFALKSEDRFSKKDFEMWKDFLIPRSLFYFFSIFYFLFVISYIISFIFLLIKNWL